MKDSIIGVFERNARDDEPLVLLKGNYHITLKSAEDYKEILKMLDE